MKLYFKLLFIASIILISLGSVPFSEATRTINISIKDSFALGEDLKFNYTISSDIEEEIYYYAHIACPNAPMAMIEEESGKIGVNSPLEREYDNYLKITNYISSQTCKAYIQILSPFQQVGEVSFEIITEPIINIKTLICKDELCLNQTKSI